MQTHRQNKNNGSLEYWQVFQLKLNKPLTKSRCVLCIEL